MVITNKIKFYREQRQLTQRALAEKANISERQCRKIEKGEQDPRLSTMLKIADALNTTICRLIEQNYYDTTCFCYQQKQTYD